MFGEDFELESRRQEYGYYDEQEMNELFEEDVPKLYVPICKWTEDGEEKSDVIFHPTSLEDAREKANKALSCWLKNSPSTYIDFGVTSVVLTKEQYDKMLEKELETT